MVSKNAVGMGGVSAGLCRVPSKSKERITSGFGQASSVLTAGKLQGNGRWARVDAFAVARSVRRPMMLDGVCRGFLGLGKWRGHGGSVSF